MTIDVSSYIAKIPPLNAGKPKFIATLKMLLQPFVDAQNFVYSIPSYFDLDSAIGAQLDIVGKWVNRSRQIPVPLPAPWLCCDDPLHGIDFAPVYVPGLSSGTALTGLDDDTYRRLLKAKIAANSWDGTAESARVILQSFFDEFPGCNVIVQDAMNGSMILAITGVIPPLVDLQIVAQSLIIDKPQGISCLTLVASKHGQPIAGCDVENYLISGCDVGWVGVDPGYFTANSP